MKTLSIIMLFFFATISYGQTVGTALFVRDTLVIGGANYGTVWGENIPIDSVSTYEIQVATIGKKWPPPIALNFRVIAQVGKDGIYGDTIVLATKTGAANVAATCTTLTGKALMSSLLGAGADSTTTWSFRASGGFSMRLGLKPYSSNRGGVSYYVYNKEW
jgi:hypothetical protein